MRIKNEVLYRFGQFDSKRRFEFTDERVGFGSYCVLTQTAVRTPSAAWPFSVWNHAKTQKFAKAALAAGLVTENDLVAV